MTTGPLQFSIADLEREIKAIGALARGFLEPEAEQLLAELAESVRQVRSHGRAVLRIPRDRPLRTIPTEGDHERSGGGAPSALYAELTCVWDVGAVQDRPRRTPSHLRVAGRASTVVELYDRATRVLGSDEIPLAMWRMEVGVPGGPGAYFHVQIGKDDHRDPPFPHWLAVPRLPCYLMTPPAALEYTLGELFQRRWPEAMTRRPSERGIWSSIQAGRIERTFREQLEAVRRNEAGTPFASLKKWQPDDTLYA